MTLTKKEKRIFEKYFGIYEDDTCMELEDWTNGGVNMFIYIDKEEEKTATQQFINYVDNFDIDEEIDLHRQAKDYREAFRITESVKDFENWLKYCNKIKKELIK